MAHAQRTFAFPQRVKPEENIERAQLMQALSDTRVRINQAYSSFNSAGDHELIESYVFEINALQSRYSYLLRRIKELEAEA